MASNWQQAEENTAADERALIERIQRGEREEFRLLVLRYQGRVFNLALRLLGNPQEAEDCAQEAFLKAYKNLNRFAGASSFYTWLYRITANLALSRIRYLERRGRGKTRSLDGDQEREAVRPLDPPDPGPGPREQAMDQDLERQIHAALARLPATYRVVVVLRDLEDRSYDEVAELTGLPLGTVKSRLHEGRAKLQQMLQEYI